MTQSSASNDAFNDSLNFVKKLWGQMSVPGMSMPSMSGVAIPGMPLPSMSLEDLDKRIQELKTVESWLNVNTTMLRSTIQALEVQRATIATLHSLSSTMSKTMQGMGSETTNSSADEAQENKSEKSRSKTESKGYSAKEISPIIAQSAAWWQGVQEQFKQALGTALEKSAANYEAAKSASESLVKVTTNATTKAPHSKISSTEPKSKARSSGKSVRKAPARSSLKSSAKAKTTPKI